MSNDIDEDVKEEPTVGSLLEDLLEEEGVTATVTQERTMELKCRDDVQLLTEGLNNVARYHCESIDRDMNIDEVLEYCIDNKLVTKIIIDGKEFESDKLHIYALRYCIWCTLGMDEEVCAFSCGDLHSLLNCSYGSSFFRRPISWSTTVQFDLKKRKEVKDV